VQFKHVPQKIKHFREFLKGVFQDAQFFLKNLGLLMFLDDFGHIYRAKNFVKSKTPNAPKDMKKIFQRCSKNCNT
jgi:hypothetical protein